MIFGVISDTHHHSWSAFSTVNSDGVNSRLEEICNETLRAAHEVKDRGGKTLFHCGDLFHVRGSVAPSVLNKVMDTYRAIKHLGIDVVLIAGNHDMEGNESNRLTNAITPLEAIGHEAISSPELGGRFLLIPWIKDIAKLKEELQSVGKPILRSELTVMMHAPMDGVIPGLPDHGLDPAWLSSLGYKRIFCGHYHHHKEAAPNVYSVGALTHQTWGDVGSKAGFLIVDDDAGTVQWFASRAPSFVDLKAGMEEEEMLDLCDGNYVRVRLVTSNTGEIDAMRQLLLDNGAKGVTILAEPPKSTGTRTASAVMAGASIDASLSAYVADHVEPRFVADVQVQAAACLAEARAL